MPKESGSVIHELKPGLEPQQSDKAQPEVDAVTKKLYQDVQSSMVQIKVDDGSGSGFVVSQNGDIATDAHVVLGSKHIKVITADGVEHQARLTKLDDVNDLAVVHIEGALPQHLKPLRLGSSSSLNPDQPVWGFGHPEGWKQLYVEPGYYRHIESGQDVLNSESELMHAKKALAAMTPKEKEEANEDLKRTLLNARVNVQHGSSGGPLLDRAGTVVGVTDLSDTQSNSDFTPVEKLIALMSETKPKFKFSYKTIDGELTLTDIYRTNGDYRSPFVDNLLTSEDAHRNSATGHGH